MVEDDDFVGSGKKQSDTGSFIFEVLLPEGEEKEREEEGEGGEGEEEFKFLFDRPPLKSEPPKARIESISNYGVVKVAFDQ